MKKKLLYEVPEAEQFFVRFEQGILTVSDGWSDPNSTPSITDEDPDDDTKNFGF